MLSNGTVWNAYFSVDICLSCWLQIASDNIENLPKLVEDIVQTSINTGPRGVLRLAQGVQAVIGVGQEWLTDLSKVTHYCFTGFLLNNS